MLTFDNFIGNRDLIRLIKLSIEAAKARNEPLPHLLLKGPAGTGKTSLAEIIAREMDAELLVLTPNTARKSEDLRRFFLRIPGDGYDDQGNIIGPIKAPIIFIDECHQLPLRAQENLGIAMQDWRLPVVVDGEDKFEWVPRFCLIGATTLPGKLSKPFLDRFKLQGDFATYTLEEAAEIAKVHASQRELEIEEGVAEAIARRSRGVARLVVRFLDRIQDAAIVVAQRSGRREEAKRITRQLAETVLQEFLKIDDRGLSQADIKLLTYLSKMSFPVGLDTLATVLNESPDTIQNSLEPFLIQEGLLARTNRGRVITDEGRRYLAAAGYVSSGPGSGRIVSR